VVVSWARQTLVDQQEVEYDFKYHQSSFRVDLPVLVLSNRKSLVSSLSLALQPARRLVWCSEWLHHH
jgi:hypothetical protein